MFQKVLDFWFKEIDRSLWFKKDSEFDAQLSRRFKNLHLQASRCELWPWRTSAKGRLAEVIVLDQFSRNLFRDNPQAFASDALALALAQEAINRENDLELEFVERSFLYMPFMHSESLAIHESGCKLFSIQGLESSYEYELKHKEIIEKFGRYPHRNKILGRTSTEAELEFLKNPGSSF